MTPEQIIKELLPWGNFIFSAGTLAMGFKIWGTVNRAIGQNKGEHKGMQSQIHENIASIGDAHRRIDIHLEK